MFDYYDESYDYDDADLDTRLLSDRRPKPLMRTIEEFGKDLRSIKFSTMNRFLSYVYGDVVISHIGNGCPKLETLIIESVDETYKYLAISREHLDYLSDDCKELKELKITNVTFEDVFDESEIEEIFPNCNVETKECLFLDAMLCEHCEMYLDDCLCGIDPPNSDSDNSDQDSNIERADDGDETNDILDYFDKEDD